MRVGLVTGEYPPMRGGISTQTRLLAEKLTQAGDTVFVFTDARAGEAVAGVHLTATCAAGGWARCGGCGSGRRTINWTS